NADRRVRAVVGRILDVGKVVSGEFDNVRARAALDADLHPPGEVAVGHGESVRAGAQLDVELQGVDRITQADKADVGKLDHVVSGVRVDADVRRTGDAAVVHGEPVLTLAEPHVKLQGRGLAARTT